MQGDEMKIAGLAVMFFILAAITTAQERDTLRVTDVLIQKRLVFPGTSNSLGSVTLLPSLRESDAAVSRNFPASSFGMALLSKPSSPESAAGTSWHMTLRRKGDDPLETLRMMLGAVEAGGASYLAYRHLSKYGFLK